MGVLLGDANGGGTVNSADATVVRDRSGKVTDSTNFRADVNADGLINSADATIVRSRSGSTISGLTNPRAEKLVKQEQQR
jgi:Dockerin type I domain